MRLKKLYLRISAPASLFNDTKGWERAEIAMNFMMSMPLDGCGIDSQPPKLMFLSGFDKTYCGATRAFVLQNYQKERTQAAMLTKIRSKNCHHSGVAKHKQQQSKVPKLAPKKHSSHKKIILHDDRAGCKAMAKPGFTSIDFISAARNDPFSTLVKRTTVEEDFLVDYYVGELIEYYGASSESRFHPPRDVCFATVMQDKAAFYAMLSYSSKHMAMRKGLYDCEQSRRYHIKSMAEIRNLVTDPKTCSSDTTMMAMIGVLAYHADLRTPHITEESALETEIHLKGLHSIICNHGGFLKFSDRLAISWVLNWYDLLSFGKLSSDTTPFSKHAFMSPSKLLVSNASHHRQATAAQFESERLALMAEEFVGIYGSLYKAAYDRFLLAHLYNDVPRIDHLFSETSVSGKVFLCAKLEYKPDPRIIALLYINLALYDCRDSLKEFIEHFSARIQPKIECSKPFAPDSIMGAYLWPLITDIENRRIEDPFRVWTTSRALRVYSQLSTNLQSRTELALIRFLRAGEWDPQTGTPTPEQFRTLVMDDLGYERLS